MNTLHGQVVDLQARTTEVRRAVMHLMDAIEVIWLDQAAGAGEPGAAAAPGIGEWAGVSSE